MNIELVAPRSLSAILRDALRVYARFPFVLMAIGLVQVPFWMLELFPLAPISDSFLNRLLLFVAEQALIPLLVGARIFAANDAILGLRPDALRSFEAAARRWVALVATFILGTALTIASLFAAPYFVVRWNFSETAVMLDGKRNWSALDRSADLVRGQWWRVLGVLLVLLSWGFVNQLWTPDLRSSRL